MFPRGASAPGAALGDDAGHLETTEEPPRGDSWPLDKATENVQLNRGLSFESDNSSALECGDIEDETVASPWPGRASSLETDDGFGTSSSTYDAAKFYATLYGRDPASLCAGPAANIQRHQLGDTANRPPGLPSPAGCNVYPPLGDIARSSDPVVLSAGDGPEAPAKTFTLKPPFARQDTPEGLIFPDYSLAPARVRPLTPCNEKSPMNVLLQDGREAAQGASPIPASSDVDQESSDENLQVAAKEPAASEEGDEATILHEVKRLCDQMDPTAEELEAIAKHCAYLAHCKRSAVTPPSQVPPAQDVNPISPLAGVPGYPPYPPLGVPPMQMPPPYGMMPPWPPYPMPWNYPPTAPEQQQKKKKDQRRKGEQYEMDDDTRKALQDVPEEQLTTIMLRNIPLNYSRDQVESLLNRHGFKGKYDLLYLPRDFDKRANFGYAFINFWEHSEADRARKEFHHFKNWGNQSQKVSLVNWAKIQGRERSLAHWKISPVMSQGVDKCDKPMCYDKDGNKAEDLLKPDKEPRRPRPKKNHTSGAAKSEPQLPMQGYGGYAYPYGIPSPGLWPYC